MGISLTVYRYSFDGNTVTDNSMEFVFKDDSELENNPNYPNIVKIDSYVSCYREPGSVLWSSTAYYGDTSEDSNGGAFIDSYTGWGHK